MKSEFNKFYRRIVGESVEDTIVSVKADQKPAKAKKEEKQEKPVEEDNGVKTLEKDFLDKFIRYNELQMLMKDLPEIANSFKSIQGFDEQLIRDTVEKLLTDRQKEIDTLTKDLTTLRDKITKEAEVANYKKSVIDIFDSQSHELANRGNSQYAYGYTAKDNGEAYNNGETLAAADGIPTVSVGMPEVTDDNPAEQIPDEMQPEELPDDIGAQPGEIDDLNQAIEKGADALKPVPTKKQTGKLGKTRLKSLEKTNLPNVLIDSKKKKTTKKTKK